VGGEAGADGAVDAVGGDDEVGLREVLGRRFLAEAQLDAELAGALLQEQEQGAAGAAAEAVAADAVDGALGVAPWARPGMDRDVVPVGEAFGDGAVARRVGGGEGVERGVAEDDAEAEAVVGAVALDHGDAGVGEVALHQDGEVEPGGAAADDRDAHDGPPLAAIV
jgi:hypothetical protein